MDIDKLYEEFNKKVQEQVEGSFFKKRDGSRYTLFTREEIPNEIDNSNPETFIPFLRDLDYPYIEQEWNRLCRTYGIENKDVFSKYVNQMRLPAYKKFGFADSKIETTDKKLKGYMFDSLVFRFKEYQLRAFQIEVMDYKYNHNTNEQEARNKIRDRHNRDLMRFIQILDEAIGDHD